MILLTMRGGRMYTSDPPAVAPCTSVGGARIWVFAISNSVSVSAP
jgi:hypothetical protein